MALECLGPLEFRACPELRRRQPERRSADGHGQARVHQYPAQGHRVGLTCFIAPGVDGLGEADLAWLRAAVDELGGVLQDEDWSLARSLRRHGEGARRERLRYRRGATPPSGTRPRLSGSPAETTSSSCQPASPATVFPLICDPPRIGVTDRITEDSMGANLVQRDVGN